MSNTLDDQVLYFQMGAITIVGDGGVVEDGSGNEVDGTVVGGAAVIPDSLFGSTIFFDGDADYVNVDVGAGGVSGALNGSAYTITGWLRPDSLRTAASEYGIPNVFLAQTSADAGDNLQMGVDQDGNLRLHLGLEGGTRDLTVGAGELAAASWHFVALVFNAGEITVHLDDDVYAESATGSAAMAAVAAPTLRLGGTTGSDVAFRGALHDVRVFDGALTEDAVRAIKSVDLTTATTPSRSSVLFDFSVTDSRGQPTLYIVDENADETTTLTIENTASRALAIPTVAAAELNADTAPFQLWFRAGVLDASCYPDATTGEGGISSASTGWNWRIQEESDGSGVILLAPSADTTLEVGGTLSFAMAGLSADAAGGARGTRVMLAFQSVGFPGDDGAGELSAAAVSGYRQVYLHIANQSGKRTTPLVMAFVGSNAVINNGESNSFTLSVINPTGNDVSLSGDPDAPTRFIFAVPVADDETDAEDVSALCTADQALAISARGESGWVSESANQGSRVQWVFTVGSGGPDRIAANDHVEFVFTGLETIQASGRTLVAMHYQNLPGYWDGYLSVAIEKAPVRYDGANVGVGIAAPEDTLHVRAESDAAAGISIENAKGDARLLFRTEDAPQIGIEMRSGPGLAVRDHVAGKDRLVIDEAGRVGIGKTPESPFTLEVAGDVRFRASGGGDSGRIWTGYEDNNFGLYLYDKDDASTIRFRNDPETDSESEPAYEAQLAGRNGKIGINTLSPTRTLDVKGDLGVAEGAAIAGDAAVGGALEVAGATTLEGALQVGGATTLQDALSVAGAATLQDALKVAGAAETGDLSVLGNLALTGMLGEITQTKYGYYWQIGTVKLQWGTYSITSNYDDSRSWNFATPFSSICHFVLLNRLASNTKYMLLPASWNLSTFVVDPTDKIDTSTKFCWFALGI